LYRVEAEVLVCWPRADAIVAAKTAQKTPDGSYNIERILKGVSAAAVGFCSVTRMDARGLTDADIFLPVVQRSTMNELAEVTPAADKD
jgi:uncharacterized protein involved in oxidation of intracellular sulfur